MTAKQIDEEEVEGTEKNERVGKMREERTFENTTELGGWKKDEGENVRSRERDRGKEGREVREWKDREN